MSTKGREDGYRVIMLSHLPQERTTLSSSLFWVRYPEGAPRRSSSQPPSKEMLEPYILQRNKARFRGGKKITQSHTGRERQNS